MSSRPPRERDSFIQELAMRLGVADRRAVDDDPPTAPQRRLTDEMEIPSFTGSSDRAEREDLDARERHQRQLDPTSR